MIQKSFFSVSQKKTLQVSVVLTLLSGIFVRTDVRVGVESPKEEAIVFFLKPLPMRVGQCGYYFSRPWGQLWSNFCYDLSLPSWRTAC